MAGIKHTFRSTIVDGTDTSVVRPSDWNANHTIENGSIPLSALESEISGISGYSGIGASGYSGSLGISGYSGYLGPSGYSGIGKSGATKVVAASNSISQYADYVCVGNNDQNVINNAINSVSPGGRVILLDGTYSINNSSQYRGIYLSDTNNNFDITLEGQGWGTILKIPNGHSQQLSMLYAYGENNPLTGLKLKNFRVDGNKSNVSGIFYMGIAQVNVADSDVEGVYLSNGKGDGQGDGYGYWFANCNNIRYSKCNGLDWDFEPVEIRSSQKIRFSQCTLQYRIELYDDTHYIDFTDCDFIDMGIYCGTDTSTNSFCKQIKINNNRFTNTVNDGRVNGFGVISLSRAIQCEAIGNQITLLTPYATALNGASGLGHHLISGNSIYCEQGNTGIYGRFVRSNIIGNYVYLLAGGDGIYLAEGGNGNGAVNNNVMGNYVYNANPSNYATTGVRTDLDAHYNYISNNYFNGAGDCISISSGYNRISGNHMTGNMNRGMRFYNTSHNNLVTPDNIVSGFYNVAVENITNDGTDNVVMEPWG